MLTRVCKKILQTLSGNFRNCYRIRSRTMASNAGYPMEKLVEMQSTFMKDDKLRLAQKAITAESTLDLMADKQNQMAHRFNTKVTPEVKPVTNQKASGRCWIYACLNAMRTMFCQAHDCEELEFSQTHTFFWDKVERCAYHLTTLLDLIKCGERVGDRLLDHLLSDPMSDGGQWQMLTNIIEKHGVVPSNSWPSSWPAANSRLFRATLNNKLREYACEFTKMVESGATDEQLLSRKEEMMKTLYNIITVNLGSPPQTVTLEFYTKNKVMYKSIGPVTPQELYQKHVKPLYNLENKLCLIHDPRNEYYKLYTVAYLNNMDNADKVKYLNLPIDEVKKYARQSIEDNEAVWFGCDVGQESHRAQSALRRSMFDYELFYATKVDVMDKAERLRYGESAMTHAMVLTACQVEGTGEVKKTTKWRIENSWGETGASAGTGKGYFVMDDDWFNEYVYEVAIDKKRLPQDVLDVLELEPIVLPAWDPMGTLAQ